MALGGGVDLFVNLKAHNADALAGIAGVRGALRGLDREQGRSIATERQKARQVALTNRELSQQSRHLQALTLDYVASRKALLSLVVRGSVTGFNSLTAAIESAGQAAAGLAGSLGEAAAAGGLLASQGIMSAVQGMTVLKFAMKDVGKTLTLTGDQFDNAFKKLTRPAQDFILQVKDMRGEFQQLKMIGQEGMFPGIVAGMKAIRTQAPMIKQVVYDTAEVIGYLAKRAGYEVANNGAQIQRVLYRNNSVLRKMGDGAINLGAAFIDAMDGGGQSIDSMSDRVLRWTQKIRSEAYNLNKNNGFREFFYTAEQEALKWVHTTSNLAHTGFSYLKAGQPIIEDMTSSIEKQTGEWRKWAKSQEGQEKMAATWKRLAPVSAEFSKAIGATVKNWAEMGVSGAENMERIFKGYRTKLLPMIHELGDNLNKNVLPYIIDIVSELADIWKSAQPGIEMMEELLTKFVLKPLHSVLNAANELQDNMTGLPGKIASLGIPLMVLMGWKRLRLEAAEFFLLMRQKVGLAPDFGPMIASTGAGGGPRVMPGYAPSRGAGRNTVARRLGLQRPEDVYPRTLGARSDIPARSRAYPLNSQVPTREASTRRISGLGRQLNPYATMAPGEGMGRIFTTDGRGRLHLRNTNVRGRQFARYGYQPYDEYVGTNPAGAPFVTRSRPGVRPKYPKGYKVTGIRRGVGGELGLPDMRDVARREREVLNSRSSRVKDYADFQRGIHPDIDPRGVRGLQSRPWRSRAGMPTPKETVKSFERSVFDGSKRGLERAGKAMKGPLAKGLFAAAAFSGVLSGLQSTKLGVKGHLQNFASGITMGLTESADSKSARLTKGTMDALAHNGRLTATARDAGLGSVDGRSGHVFIADTVKGVQEFKRNWIKALHDGKEITDGQFDALNKGADEVIRKMKAGKRLKGFGIDFDSKGVIGDVNRVIGSFKNLQSKLPMSVKTIQGQVKYGMRQISRNMDMDSFAGKQAMAKNFNLAVAAVKRNMKAGFISTKEGTTAIRRLMAQELKVYGLTGKQVKLYMSGQDTLTGKRDGTAKGQAHGGSGYGSDGSLNSGIGKARGGLVTVGRKGDSGGDNVALNAVVGRGEDVAVMNRHQRRALDERLADVGGVSGFFRGRWPKHTEPVKAARGFDSGAGLPAPNFGGHPSNVNKNIAKLISVLQSRFGLGVGSTTDHGLTSSGRRSDHQDGNAVDLSSDPATMYQAAGYIKHSGIASKLKQGIHNPNLSINLGKEVPSSFWGGDWARHIDHIHLAMLGSGDFQAKMAKAIKYRGIPNVATGLPGMLGGIANTALGNVRNAVNDRLRTIADALNKRNSMGGADDSIDISAMGGSFGKGELEKLWTAAGGPSNLSNLAAAIALAESRGDPNAHNASGASGLWQILGSVVPGNVFDPMVNARNAVKKWRDAGGFSPWVAYTNGNYKAFLQRGGLFEAARGLISGSGIPTQGGGFPTPDPSDAVGRGGHEHGKKDKKDKTGKKKKKAADKPEPPKYGKVRVNQDEVKRAIAHSRDLQKHGVKNRKKFEKKFHVSKAVKHLQKMLKGGKWPNDPDFYDPLTGEELDASQFPAFRKMRVNQEQYDALDKYLTQRVIPKQERTGEFPTVDLEGQKQIRHWLTTSLGWNEAQANAYILQEGFDKRGSITVPNPGGANKIAGKRGIQEAGVELNEQMAYLKAERHRMKNVLHQGSQIEVNGPLAKRRHRLKEMKDIFETNKKVMQKLRKKLKKGKNVGWQAQVKDNKEIIDALRDHLRVSHRLPENYRDKINTEINDLTDLNTKLEKSKPQGTVGLTKAEESYNVRAREQNILIGDSSPNAVWPGGGGLSQFAINSLTKWKEMREYKQTSMSDARDNIASLDGSIRDLKSEISGLGLDVELPRLSDIDTSQTDAQNALLDSIKLQQATDQLRARDLEASQFGRLRDFAQDVGGRFLGSFAHGTTSIEKSGLALVHRNETIVPDPDGAFRNGRTMNALRGGGDAPLHLELVLGGDVAGLVKVVDARINGRAADSVSTQTGQRSRLIRAAR